MEEETDLEEEGVPWWNYSKVSDERKNEAYVVILPGVTCHKSCSAGRALRLDIILLKDDPSLGQVLQVGGDDGGVVPGDIIVAKVICYYQDYVRLMSGLLGLAWGKNKEEEEKVEVCLHLYNL